MSHKLISIALTVASAACVGVLLALGALMFVAVLTMAGR